MYNLFPVQDHPRGVALPQIDNIDPLSLSYNRTRGGEEREVSSGSFNWRGDFDWTVVKYADVGRKVKLSMFIQCFFVAFCRKKIVRKLF